MKDPEEKKVLFFDWDDKQNKSVEKVMRRLMISVDFTKDENEFLQQLRNNRYTHIFMPAQFYRGFAEQINAETEPTSDLILICSYGDSQMEETNVHYIHRPLYSINLADALNQEYSAKCDNENYKESFIAPDVHVLVVDDNLVNLKVAEGLLKPYKVNVDMASSGRECLRMIEKNPIYQIVLLDHMMPGMDGIETLNMIRNIGTDYVKTLPVIALTANAVKDAQSMFKNSGFDDFISKPIDVGKLEQTMLKYIPEDKLQKIMVTNQSMKEIEIKIEGVDTSIGLKQWNGNVSKYRNILSVVYSDGMEKKEQLKVYLEKEQFHNYMIEAHSIKSVAGSIGALHLSEMAKEQEFAAQRQDFDWIRTSGRQFIAEYEALLDSIEGAIESGDKVNQLHNTKKKDISEEQLHHKLSDILDLTKDYEDEAALKLCEELLTYQLETSRKQQLEQVIQALKRLEYSKVIELLK